MMVVLPSRESRQALLMALPRGLPLRTGDRPVLEQWVRSQTQPHRQVQRARMLLGLVDGRTLAAVGAAVGALRRAHALEREPDGPGDRFLARIHRWWRATGIQSHRVHTFTRSSDPRFEAKLWDVVAVLENKGSPAS